MLAEQGPASQPTGVKSPSLGWLFENPAVGIMITAVPAGGRIEQSNRTLHRMLGYPQGGLQGLRLADILHPEDLSETRRLFDEVTSGRRETFDLEARYVRRDGSSFWGRLTVYAVRDTGTAPTHAVGLIEDISERKAAEQQQVASTRRLEALLDAAVDAIVMIDPMGTVLTVNPATERLFGYTSAELLGQNVRMLMPAPYRQEHDGYLARYRRSGERRIIGIGREVEARRKDGTVFPVDLAVSEVWVEKERLFIGMIRDLTERKLLQDSLLQSQKMEAVGRLAGGVAHDFNTLLGTIRGYSEILEAVLPPGEPAQGYAQKIHRAALRGAELTRHLLVFARREEVQPRRVQLEALMAETSDMLERLIGEDITVTRRIQPELGSVHLDPGQLQQVMLNLAVNAADAMPRGGSLRLEWQRQILDEEMAIEGGRLAPGTYAVLEVEDDGTGMDEETRRRAFEPFFTTKAIGKGTGLGLATVFGIVTRSGGGIRLESSPGRGTCFQLFFPEIAVEPRIPVSAEPAGDRAANQAQQRRCSESVLLVEDDAMFRGLMQEVLASQGYRVVTASNPEEALTACAELQEPVRVLVSDLVMPGGTGIELARTLTGRFPGLRVILMSGYSGDSLESRDLGQVRADAFLEKPFPIETLLRHLREVLEEPFSGD